MVEILFVLALVFLAITVVGHLSWVSLAWLFRTLSGAPEQPLDTSRVRCPWCNRLTTKSSGRCDWCAQSLRGEVPEEMADLAAVKELRQWQR
jgi:uncharacterized paraquat-inducible protein A